MRIAHIENGKVVNAIEGDADLVDGINYVVSDTAGIGDDCANGIITPAPQAVDAPTIDSVRADRDRRIAAEAWKYERNAREVRLGLTPTDDIVALDKYVQALADLPASWPNIKWPTL